MSELSDQPTVEAPEGTRPETDRATDPVADLVARAREACSDHPELLEQLDHLVRLDEVELSRRPEVLDTAHRTLREVLTGAGRPGPRP